MVSRFRPFEGTVVSPEVDTVRFVLFIYFFFFLQEKLTNWLLDKLLVSVHLQGQLTGFEACDTVTIERGALPGRYALK